MWPAELDGVVGGGGGDGLTFIDMFCGMGTVRMGFEQAGHECVYSIEWDKHKRKIYEVIFGREPEASDICAVRGTDLPLSDCWCFGAPCQDFSMAGIREGLGGDRSSLVREVFRLVWETPQEHRPEWLLYENVKGMLSSNKGLDYLEILCEMASLGYDIQYELLNSKDFGVPQNRERVYTLGHLRRCGEREVFPIGKGCKQFSEKLTNLRKQKEAIGGFYFSASKKFTRPLLIGISRCLKAHQNDEAVMFNDGTARKFTPKERMRLQGVPDYITEKLISSGISDSEIATAAGDACTVNVIYEIAKAMTRSAEKAEVSP